jgi:hypothetical protein
VADDLARLKAVTKFSWVAADSLQRRGKPRAEVAELRALLHTSDALCSDPDPDRQQVAAVLRRIVWYLDLLADES